uniref:Sodium:proton antiporter n=1 Tax=Ignisphaera aggregans TaxID=334771 RepID=A0A7C2VLJ7_9CREN
MKIVLVSGNSYDVVYIATIAAGLAFIVLSVLYYTTRSRRVRVTPVYLSGEKEDVVSSVSPSVATLYWGFMKRFARALYDALIGRVHTGSLHDWYKFLSSWLSWLLLLAIVVFVLILVVG